jgi:hypothetical protein
MVYASIGVVASTLWPLIFLRRMTQSLGQCAVATTIDSAIAVHTTPLIACAQETT